MAPKRNVGASHPADPEALQARIKELEKASVEEHKKRSAADSARKKEVSGQQKKLTKEIGVYKGIVKKCEGKVAKLRKEQEKIVGLEKQNHVKRAQLIQKMDDMLLKSEERRKMIGMELEETNAEFRVASAKLAYLYQAVAVLKQPLEVLFPDPIDVPDPATDAASHPPALEDAPKEPRDTEVHIAGEAERPGDTLQDAPGEESSPLAHAAGRPETAAAGTFINNAEPGVRVVAPMPSAASVETGTEWVEVSAAEESIATEWLSQGVDGENKAHQEVSISTEWPQQDTAGAEESLSAEWPPRALGHDEDEKGDSSDIQHELRQNLLRLSAMDAEDIEHRRERHLEFFETIVQRVQEMLVEDGIPEATADKLADAVTDVVAASLHTMLPPSLDTTVYNEKIETATEPIGSSPHATGDDLEVSKQRAMQQLPDSAAHNLVVNKTSMMQHLQQAAGRFHRLHLQLHACSQKLSSGVALDVIRGELLNTGPMLRSVLSWLCAACPGLSAQLAVPAQIVQSVVVEGKALWKDDEHDVADFLAASQLKNPHRAGSIVRDFQSLLSALDGMAGKYA